MKLHRRECLFLAGAAAIAPAALVRVACAETYPARPVRIIVGYVAGSGPDVLARTLAAQLGADLGQQFFVENRAGANGTLGTQVVVQSESDGYTLLFSSSSIAPSAPRLNGPGCPGAGAGRPARRRMTEIGIEKNSLRSAVE